MLGPVKPDIFGLAGCCRYPSHSSNAFMLFLVVRLETPFHEASQIFRGFGVKRIWPERSWSCCRDGIGRAGFYLW